MAGIADLLWQQNVQQAPQRNDSDASRFIVDALMEAGGKLGAAPAEIAQALMAPGNALRGEYAPGIGSQTDPRMVEDAASLAGLVSLGAAPIPRPMNSLGMGGRSMPVREYPIAPRSEWYGEANFDSAGGVMRYMTPDEYLSRAKPLELDDYSLENIAELRAHMESGRTLDPLKFFDGGKEDGRHRAYAAKELGIELVPVIEFGDQIGYSLGMGGVRTPPSFDEYINKVNPGRIRISADDRPNLGMGDMYGMMPRGSTQVGSLDAGDLGQVRFMKAQDGSYYASGWNPDVMENDVFGYAMPRGDNMVELAVVNEAQGRGIGSQLQYLLRRDRPYLQSGGLTEQGESALRKTYERLIREGLL